MVADPARFDDFGPKKWKADPSDPRRRAWLGHRYARVESASADEIFQLALWALEQAGAPPVRDRQALVRDLRLAIIEHTFEGRLGHAIGRRLDPNEVVELPSYAEVGALLGGDAGLGRYWRGVWAKRSFEAKAWLPPSIVEGLRQSTPRFPPQSTPPGEEEPGKSDSDSHPDSHPDFHLNGREPGEVEPDANCPAVPADPSSPPPPLEESVSPCQDGAPEAHEEGTDSLTPSDLGWLLPYVEQVRQCLPFRATGNDEAILRKAVAAHGLGRVAWLLRFWATDARAEGSRRRAEKGQWHPTLAYPFEAHGLEQAGSGTLTAVELHRLRGGNDAEGARPPGPFAELAEAFDPADPAEASLAEGLTVAQSLEEADACLERAAVRAWDALPSEERATRLRAALKTTREACPMLDDDALRHNARQAALLDLQHDRWPSLSSGEALQWALLQKAPQ